MALGARPIQALVLVARESLAVVGVGVLLGIAGALASARRIPGLLFGIGPADPLALLGAAAVRGAVSLVATLLPARRAALVDPAVAVRAEWSLPRDGEGGPPRGAGCEQGAPARRAVGRAARTRVRGSC